MSLLLMEINRTCILAYYDIKRLYAIPAASKTKL
jgi:hypothetical protein